MQEFIDWFIVALPSLLILTFLTWSIIRNMKNKRRISALERDVEHLQAERYEYASNDRLNICIQGVCERLSIQETKLEERTRKL
jgi:di/tricarboxylate transporter